MSAAGPRKKHCELRLNWTLRAAASKSNALDCSMYLWKNRTWPLLKGWPTGKTMKLVGRETRFRAAVGIRVVSNGLFDDAYIKPPSPTHKRRARKHEGLHAWATGAECNLDGRINSTFERRDGCELASSHQADTLASGGAGPRDPTVTPCHTDIFVKLM